MKGVRIEDLDRAADVLAAVVTRAKKRPGVRYVDVRLGASEGSASLAEDGQSKAASRDWSLSLGVRVLSDRGSLAMGFEGRHLGQNDWRRLERTASQVLQGAAEKAKANSLTKKRFLRRVGQLGKTVKELTLAPIEVRQDRVSAVFKIDPRNVSQQEITDFAREASDASKSHHSWIRRAEAAVATEISRQIFVSSEGALIDQSSCLSGGTVFVLAQDKGRGRPVDLYHHTGNQLGFEALKLGQNAHRQNFIDFCRQIAGEARELAGAEPAPATTKPVTVVLDPDLVALFAHEIIGHPSELDRALKMETGYAGRSWFFRDSKDNQIGQRIGSVKLSAFSDPTLRGGYGFYLYDDEGTPAQRVYHIKNGVFQDFMNSRQTASVLGRRPNGHYKANDASVVPLIRMSVSAIEAGADEPAKIIREVENGFYCVGHRLPSISESRENFEIAPRLIYEIKRGRLGRVFRDGRLRGNSRDFFLNIDAVGKDFTIFPIPNCGKGQPMQSKAVGNGGPTIRSRAFLAPGK